jgi:hypothetical protein
MGLFEDAKNSDLAMEKMQKICAYWDTISKIGKAGPWPLNKVKVLKIISLVDQQLACVEEMKILTKDLKETDYPEITSLVRSKNSNKNIEKTIKNAMKVWQKYLNRGKPSSKKKFTSKEKPCSP